MNGITDCMGIIPFRKKKTTDDQFTATMVNVSNSLHDAADDFDDRCGFISSVADVMACISCQG